MRSVYASRTVRLTRLFTFIPLLAVAQLVSFPGSAATWKGVYDDNPTGPGQQVEIKRDGKVVARLLYGDGQMKPFLHLYGRDQQELTNGGLDSKGDPAGQFPHHRGLFIGWKISSDLGTYDLWHMTSGTHMDLMEVVTKTGPDHATIIAQIKWRAGKKDTEGRDLLLTETRQLKISQPTDGMTQIDAEFTLHPERDLKLEGDLQHSGVHLRVTNSVEEKQTSYLYEPEKVQGDDLQWCQLLFPVGNQWYSAQEMNAPANPVEELSMRSYGRFGYFFKKALTKGHPLDLNYRFIIEEVKSPANPPKLSDSEKAAAVQRNRDRYEKFSASLKNADKK